MKKVIALLLLLAMAISLSSCARRNEPIDYKSMKKQKIQAVLKTWPTTLSEIEELTTDVIQAIPKESRTEVSSYGYDDVPSTAYTITKMEVTKVIDAEGIKVGDTIEVYEMYYTYEHKGEQILCYYGKYMPSEIGKEYLFFLSEGSDMNGEEILIASYFENCRYPVIDQTRSPVSIEDMTNDELDLADGDSSEYKEIYQAVIDKYMS